MQSVWNGFLGEFEKNKEKTPVIFSILKQLTPIRVTGTSVVVACENYGVKGLLEKRRGEVEAVLSQCVGKKTSLEIEVQLRKTARPAPTPLLAFQPTIDDIFARSGLHNKYRFDNFAVSGTNSVAFAAAHAVAKNPGSSYNPLFLYGGVGVGKTHLAQSVARIILEKTPTARVFFCPGDRFTNELIESIQEKSTARFRKKYRSLSLLIVDDIQFIAGKQTVQEEFFHTFNNIVSAGGQVILTSDRPPNEIKNLEDRLRSRFSGGLIVDIQLPDFELRSAILLIKAREKEIEISIEAAKIIAEQVSDSRALEGVLLSIYAKTLGKKEEIGLDDVSAFFDTKQAVKKVRISAHDIARAVCLYYNIKQIHLKGASRSESFSLPRQITMYLLRREIGMKYDEIAYFLKRKDHTTIMHGCEKIERMIIDNPVFKSEVDRIVSSFSSST